MNLLMLLLLLYLWFDLLVPAFVEFSSNQVWRTCVGHSSDETVARSVPSAWVN